MNILYIDTETTGVDPDNSSIIEIAATYEVDGKIQDEFWSKLAPKSNGVINLEALRVNKHSVTSATSLPNREANTIRFVDWILGLKAEGPLYICGHNVNFDITLIKKALKEINIIGWDSAVSYRIIDTSTIGTF